MGQRAPLPARHHRSAVKFYVLLLHPHCTIKRNRETVLFNLEVLLREGGASPFSKGERERERSMHTKYSPGLVSETPDPTSAPAGKLTSTSLQRYLMRGAAAHSPPPYFVGELESVSVGGPSSASAERVKPGNSNSRRKSSMPDILKNFLCRPCN